MEVKKKILIVEDDENLGKVLSSYLSAKGFDVQLCENGVIAYEEFIKDDYELCLLDIMMPEMDGYTLAHEIRLQDENVPIVFMSAKSMQEDILKGFKMNVDDYIVKPFSMEELLMRIHAILRRTSRSRQIESENQVFNIGKFVFDNNRQLLIYKTQQTKLTSKEAAVLYLLCKKMGKTVERNYILNKIWKNCDHYSSRSMDVYITKLRKYLKNDPEVSLLNIHGVGFKLATNK